MKMLYNTLANYLKIPIRSIYGNVFWLGEVAEYGKHPASFTSRVFQPQDKVKVSKRRGEGVVIETIKDKWFHKYNVQLLNNDDVIEVNQNELMPL